MKTSFVPLAVFATVLSLAACEGRSLIGSETAFEVPKDASIAADASTPSDAALDATFVDGAPGDAGKPTLDGATADMPSAPMCSNTSSVCGSVCCDATQACVQGQCLNSCPAALPDMCKQRCTDFDFDPWNCGACGNVCPQNYECVARTCVEID